MRLHAVFNKKIPRIGFKYANGADTLAYNGSGSIGGTFDPVTGVLTLTFKIADDNGLLLLDLKDLRSLMNFIGENATPYLYTALEQSYQPAATVHVRTSGDPGSAWYSRRRARSSGSRPRRGHAPRRPPSPRP